MSISTVDGQVGRLAKEQSRRIGRLAFGVTLAMVIAMAFEWRFSFTAPIFVAMFLGPPGHPLAGRLYLPVLAAATLAFSVGLAVVWLLLPYMLVALIGIALLLFLVFYQAHRGMNGVVVVLLLMALVMFPAVGNIDRNLAFSLAFGFLTSLAIGLGITALSYALLPAIGDAPVAPDADSEAVEPRTALKNALLSTALVMPLLCLFYFQDLNNELLVLTFVAMLAQNVSVEHGTKASAGLLIANLLGGVAAVVLYNALVAVPNLLFLALSMLLVSGWFAGKIFTHPQGKLYASAFSTLLVLVGSTIGASGGEADAKFIVRFTQVAAASIYLVGGLMLMRYLGWLDSQPRAHRAAG